MRPITQDEILTIFSGLLLIVVFYFYSYSYSHKCKKAVFYINSKSICKTYGINKDKCKIKANYCGEDKGFYEIEYKKNGKTQKDYINQNVVELIKFLTK